jgi:hypothetical protein
MGRCAFSPFVAHVERDCLAHLGPMLCSDLCATHSYYGPYGAHMGPMIGMAPMWPMVHTAHMRPMVTTARRWSMVTMVRMWPMVITAC